MKQIKINDVSATSFLTLYCHAIEAKCKDPILEDSKSIEVTDELNKIISTSPKKQFRRFAKGKIPRRMVTYIAIRAKRYDKFVTDFLKKNPNGIIVNIGCGMDSRFLRIDNGKVMFYDLDIPEIINIKKQFFKETPRYKLISSSVLNYKWMEIVSKHKEPFMFMAEGVFMYLNRDDVKSLVLELQNKFPNSELVCEVFNSLYLKQPIKSIVNFKMKYELHMGDASFNFGIKKSNEMEQWNKGIRLLEEWTYLDSGEKKIGWMKLFKNIEMFKKTQWTVHYMLG